MAKQIPLTQGKFAIVDDEDFEWLSQWKWYVLAKEPNHYAVREHYIGGTRKKRQRKTILMHREILKTPSGLQTDHINGNILDNRKINLRICNKSNNMCNRKISVNFNGRKKSSKYKGVSWDKRAQKWAAQIQVNKKNKHLGYFQNENEAAKVYNKKALELHGSYARLNEI